METRCLKLNREKHLTNEVIYISNEASFADEIKEHNTGSENTAIDGDQARDARFRMDLNKF